MPNAIPTDPLAKTLTVKINNDKDSFVFKIPTIHDDIAIGSRMTRLRRVIDPSWDGFEQGVDGITQYSLRACATFELLLEQSSATWPFTEGPDRKPVVDSAKFPAANTNDLLIAYQGFTEALTTFRAGGVAGGESTGGEAVESKPNT